MKLTYLYIEQALVTCVAPGVIHMAFYPLESDCAGDMMDEDIYVNGNCEMSEDMMSYRMDWVGFCDSKKFYISLFPEIFFDSFPEIISFNLQIF